MYIASVFDVLWTKREKCGPIWVYTLTNRSDIFCQYSCFNVIHSFTPLVCAECDDSLPFSGASSFLLCYIQFPSTLFHQLVFHPSSLHLAIYFLVYFLTSLFRNSYIIILWDFIFFHSLYILFSSFLYTSYFLPFSIHFIFFLSLYILFSSILCTFYFLPFSIHFIFFLSLYILFSSFLCTFYFLPFSIHFIFFHSPYYLFSSFLCTRPKQSNLFKLIVSLILGFLKPLHEFLFWLIFSNFLFYSYLLSLKFFFLSKMFICFLSLFVSVQVSDAYLKVLSIVVLFGLNFSFLGIFLYLKLFVAQSMFYSHFYSSL